jgi:hypothetical protein
LHENVVRSRRDAVVTFYEKRNLGYFFGNGTLIADNLILTSWEVGDRLSTVSNPVATFGHDVINGQIRQGHDYRFKRIVETGYQGRYDYAIIEVYGNPAADLNITPTPWPRICRISVIR